MQTRCWRKPLSEESSESEIQGNARVDVCIRWYRVCYPNDSVSLIKEKNGKRACIVTEQVAFIGTDYLSPTWLLGLNAMVLKLLRKD